jgi:hypothetical protein
VAVGLRQPLRASADGWECGKRIGTLALKDFTLHAALAPTATSPNSPRSLEPCPAAECAPGVSSVIASAARMSSWRAASCTRIVSSSRRVRLSASSPLPARSPRTRSASMRCSKLAILLAQSAGGFSGVSLNRGELYQQALEPAPGARQPGFARPFRPISPSFSSISRPSRSSSALASARSARPPRRRLVAQGRDRTFQGTYGARCVRRAAAHGNDGAAGRSTRSVGAHTAPLHWLPQGPQRNRRCTRASRWPSDPGPRACGVSSALIIRSVFYLVGRTIGRRGGGQAFASSVSVTSLVGSVRPQADRLPPTPRARRDTSRRSCSQHDGHAARDCSRRSVPH